MINIVILLFQMIVCISSSTIIQIPLVQKENGIFKNYSSTFHLRVMFLNIMWKLLLKRRNSWRMLWVLSYITLSRQYHIEWISIPDSSSGLKMTLTNITLLLIFSLFSFTYGTQKNIKIFRCVIESCSGWRLNQVRQHKSCLQKRAQTSCRSRVITTKSETSSTPNKIRLHLLCFAPVKTAQFSVNSSRSKKYFIKL